MTEKEAILQKLEEIENALNIIRQQTSIVEKKFEEVKLFFEQKGETKVLLELHILQKMKFVRQKGGSSMGSSRNRKLLRKI